MGRCAPQTHRFINESCLALGIFTQTESMVFTDKRQFTRWVIIIASFVIVSLIVWNTYTFFQIFKNEERIKMEYWADAQKSLMSADENTDLELPFEIIRNNTTIPIILTNENDSIISVTNIDEKSMSDPQWAGRELQRLKRENEPIAIEYVPGKFQYLYYGNSSLLNTLKYYPIALALIIVLFGAVVYNYYRSTKIATQNKLWAGMAKETAHQIGTPLSSLLGWLEILKAENVDPSTVAEIEKDIVRLQTIADRFSKIGSEPVLQPIDLVDETRRACEYLKSRFSKQVDFKFVAPNHPVPLMINAELHGWTIENLVKNAIDAMKGRGKLRVKIEDDLKQVKILVTDTGKGIPKNQFRQIFEPGFTTKKRGWGLGLSLTKRIVEDYHKGEIKVLQSEPGKGTTMQICFKKGA